MVVSPKAIVGAVRGHFVGVQADGGHGVDGVEHTFGARVACGRVRLARPSATGVVRMSQGKPRREVVVEGRHDSACRRGPITSRMAVDDGLRAAVHAAGGARKGVE